MQFHLKKSLLPGVLILLQSLYFKSALAKYVSGNLQTENNWAFLEKFCFSPGLGSFDYEIEFEYARENERNISLLFYFDDVWSKAYPGKGLTCEQKLEFLSSRYNQIVPLNTINPVAGCEVADHHKTNSSAGIKFNSSSTAIHCKGSRKLQSIKERWWFISVADCNSTIGLDLKYKLYMKNGSKHFSLDESYILPIVLSLCVMYLLLFCTAIIIAVILKRQQVLHRIYKLFLVSVGLQTVGLIILSLTYISYSLNGLDNPRVKQIGWMLETGSELVFILLLLILGNGYTITHGKLRSSGSIVIVIFIGFYIIMRSTLAIYQDYTNDPGLMRYIYETKIGFGILMLRLMAYFIFTATTISTLTRFWEKLSLYLPIWGVYTIWFLGGPVAILLLNYAIKDVLIRGQTILLVQHGISFLGHSIFLIIARPSRAEKTFRYHA